MPERLTRGGKALETFGTGGPSSSVAPLTGTDRQLRRARRALGRLITHDAWVSVEGDALVRIVHEAEDLADRIEDALRRRRGPG